MTILLWTFFPVLVAVLAVAAISIWSRPRGPANTHESVAAYDRFKAAIESTQPPRTGPTG